MEVTEKFVPDSASQKIGIIGLGFVGLPLALLFASKGYQVTGIDIDKRKIDNINSGISYLPIISNEQLITAVASGKLSAQSNFHHVANLDVIIICVPTPLTAHHTPDLSYLQEVGLELISHLRIGQLVILESSSYPGTTREVLQPILEKSGLQTGIDFYLGYSPERVDPGNNDFNIKHIPKVISGVTDNCLNKVFNLYNKVFHSVVKVSSVEIAELAKILENSYRFINISFINEITRLCDSMNLNVWEVIEAASTKPYGFSPFYPGPGIGGHCIPVDPLYLTWKAKQYDIDVEFLNLANKINHSVPSYIVNQIKKLLSSETDLSGKGILIIGVSYKKDINDVRESPAFSIINKLKNLDAIVSFYDPFVDEIEIDGARIESVLLTDDVISRADCVVILTDHSCLPIEQIIENAKLIYDTRNATKGIKENSKVFRLGGGYL